MVRLKRLDKYFNKGKSNENHVLKEISLELEDKGLVCILGESGSGKTTLLNTIGGLDTFRSGSVTVDDVVLEKYNGKRIEALRNQKFGYIFQNYYLLQDYTVAYNVKLALNVFDLTEEEKNARVDYVLEELGMSRYKKKRVSQLSGGQQQRVSIARALVKSPEIILADEPTGNLDEENTLKIMSILKSISKDCLVILVSHERAIAQFFADRIIEIRDGEIQRDYNNESRGGYQKMDDANIYLRDMEQEQLESESLSVSIYRDREERGAAADSRAAFHGMTAEAEEERMADPDSRAVSNGVAAETECGTEAAEGASGKVHMDLAWKDGKLYIQSEDNVELVLAGEETGSVMLDANRPMLEQSEVEEISYDLPRIKAGRGAGLPVGEIWKLACENIRMLGKKHRFIVGILLATSVLLVLALADYMMQHAIDMESVVTEDSHYVTVNLEASKSVMPSEMEEQITEYCERYLTEDIDYSALTAGTLTISYNGFRQLKQVNGKIKDFSVATYDKLTKEDLVCGRLPQNRTEMVMDKWLFSVFQKSGNIMAELYKNEEALLGLEVTTNIPNLELTIVGVSDTNEPTIYVDRNVMQGINYNSIYVMSDEDLRTLDPEKYKDLKLSDNEILVNEEKYAIYQDQKEWGYGQNDVTIKAESDLGMKKCKIVGKCSMESGAEYVLSQKRCEQLRLNSVIKARQFKVYTDDVDATISYFKKSEKDYTEYFRVNAVSSYRSQLETYREEQKSGINAGYLVTIAVAVLSLVMIYFTIKSNAMARSEELTVYRLIGISPGSIMRVYMLEMILITTYTCIPAILITSGVIKFITSIPSLQIYLLFPWWLALLLIVALFVLNTFISILPVNGILRKPPAQLAAKN